MFEVQLGIYNFVNTLVFCCVLKHILVRTIAWLKDNNAVFSESLTYFLFNKYIVSKVKWIDQNNVSLIYFDFNTPPPSLEKDLKSVPLNS